MKVVDDPNVGGSLEELNALLVALTVPVFMPGVLVSTFIA